MVYRNYRQQGIYALVFGLGLTFSFFFPTRFIILAIAMIVVVLAVALIKC